LPIKTLLDIVEYLELRDIYIFIRIYYRFFLVGSPYLYKHNKYSQTILYLIVVNRHKKVITLLFIGKVNLNTKDNFYQTPLLVAVKNRHKVIVELLLTVT
jgi:ankyrin repeat protein